MRHVSRLKSFVWYGTVTLLVSLAVLVTLARVSISSVSDYREHLEQMAGDYLGQPVTIGSMDARLVGFKPSILLNDVALREEGTLEQLAHFSQITIGLNPFSSLRHFSPVMDLAVSGANIVVIQRADDQFELQGVSLSQQARNVGSGGALGAWFLRQSRLALNESSITWRSEKSGRSFLFEGVNAELQNLQSRHRLNATVQLPEELGKTLRLSLDIQGNLLNRKDWAGDMYVRTEQLRPARWLKGLDIRGMRFEQGQIDLEAWSRWRAGLLESVEGQLSLAKLELTQQEKRLPLEELAAEFRFIHDPDGWQLLLQKARMTGGELFGLQVQRRSGVSSVRARNLDIEKLALFADQLPGLSEQQRKQLGAMQPMGRIDALRVELQQGAVLSAMAQVENAAIKPTGSLPGFSGLSAGVRFDGSRASIEVDSQALQLALPSLFERELALGNTRGQLLAQRQGDGWLLASRRWLEVKNEDLRLRLRTALQLRPGETPLLDLAARFSDGRVTSVPKYLPVAIMSEATVDWLNRAFVDGRLEQGELLMHGRLEPSLLKGEQGRFGVRFDTRDVSLDYSEGWPLLEKIAAEVRFSGTGMMIKAHSARLFSSSVDTTTVAIESFARPTLEVDGRVKASAGDALRFLQASPLVDDVDEVLASMEGEGATPVRLAMAIPLSAEVRETAPLSIDGEVAFTGNRLRIVDGIELSEVTGALHFSEESFKAERITASLFDAPTSIEVFTDNALQGERGATVVAIRGHASATALQEALQQPVFDLLQGESDWQARLSLRPAAGEAAQLVIFSELEGMGVQLPAPMAKPVEGKREMMLTLSLSGEASVEQLSYGERLQAIWQRDAESGTLQRAGVQLGEGPGVRLPEQPGVHISGALNRFSWEPWHEVVRRLMPDGAASRSPLPIVVRMTQLSIQPGTEGESQSASAKTVLEPGDLPPIDLLVKDFTYADMPLGEVSLRVEPQGPRVRFDDISIAAGHFSLSGKGRWSGAGGTALELNLNSPNLGRMMADLGFASVIKRGVTQVQGEVHWPGSPMAVSLQHLQANGHVVIKDGAIEEVKPGAGKLLGLLSLQALPRRLFLDFSDLSDKGMQFTSIEGDIEIRNGNAFTDNMVMKALPADILVTGRTGLLNRDFDQLVMVVPNVSDTVSVAGALAWGPQVAAALVLLQKVFKSDIDAATMTRYRVTGSWEEPVITRLEPVAAESP